MRLVLSNVRSLVAVLALLAVMGVMVSPARAEDPPEMKLCMDENQENEPRIAACTKVVENTRLATDMRTEALVARGILHDDDEEYEKAIADFGEALKMAPDDHTIFVLRGNSHDANGAPQLAIADYTTAIKLTPDDAAAYYNRATVYEDLGERDKAIADYTKALQIDPEYTDAKEALAQLKK